MPEDKFISEAEKAEQEARAARAANLFDVRRFIGGAVVFDQRFADFLRTRANKFQLALQEKTQTVDGIDV